jgi:hypothetical protein
VTTLNNLPAFDGDDLTVIIIETPGNKYAYESRYEAFALERILPAGAVFPFDL